MNMSASAVAKSGSPVKVKHLRKRHSSCENVLKTVNYEKLCMPPPSSSHKNGEKKECVCAPTKHAGSFKCRLHRVHSRRSQKHMSGLGNIGKVTHVDFIPTEDVVNPAPHPAVIKVPPPHVMKE